MKSRKCADIFGKHQLVGEVIFNARTEIENKITCMQCNLYFNEKTPRQLLISCKIGTEAEEVSRVVCTSYHSGMGTLSVKSDSFTTAEVRRLHIPYK